ncbi:MAG: BamA/TamA family outer membrane protein [Gemmatimonadota bacterium]|nr:BamA/TamA family outer membrane protein [Gemmatimonadota bacterium]
MTAGRAAPVTALLAGLAALLLPPPAGAQSSRNRVQYRPRDFRIIETAHFDIYFYEEEREAAVQAARMAERIYGRLSRILDHEFARRKPIILYASQTDFQQTNVLGGHVDESTGGVTESLRDRVLLPLTGSWAEFEHVLGHEIVHAFQFDILRRGVVEQSASPFAFVPSLWFMEGMAEYLSVGRIDAKTSAWMRDATLSGYLRTIEEMDRFHDFLSYRFGQSLWNWIGARWGDEAIGLLLKRAGALGIRGAFERTLGIGLEDLTREWHDAVRAAHVPSIRRAGDVRTVARRVTDHALPTGRASSPSYIAPALSPDGTRLVYLSDRAHDLHGFFDLWVADVETGRPLRRLAAAARSGSFESLRYLTSAAEWAPDGRRVAFVAAAGGRDALIVADAETGEVVSRWTPDLNGIQSPTWSPDGRRIAFTGLRGGISDLYAWEVGTDRLERLTADRFSQLHPAWSPDGRLLAYATDDTPESDFERLVFGPLRIAILDPATGEKSLLPGQEGGTAIDPAWSPDGSVVAYLATRAGAFDVYLHDRGAGRTTRLTHSLTGAMGEGALLTSPGLTWARAADRLAFSYFEDAGFNIYVADRPTEKAGPAGAPGSTPTAADQVGRIRLVERRGDGGGGAADGGGVVDGDGARGDGGEPSSFYRADGGFRRSDLGGDGEALAVAAAEDPRSVRALLDSASLALPDTAAFTSRDYTARLSPDIVGRPTIGAQVGGFFGNSVSGGSFVSLSDMLGNHNLWIAAAVQGSFDDAQVFTSYTYLKNRVNLGVSFRQFPFFRFFGRRSGEVPGRPGSVGQFELFQRDQFRSVGILAQAPLSSFARFDFGLEASSIQTDLVLRGFDATRGDGFTTVLDGPTRAFLVPTIAYVFDNSLPGFTGAVAGRRLRLGASLSAGDLNLADLTADLRHYTPLPGSLVFAQRLLSFTRVGTTAGDDAEEFTFAWGGPYFLRGYDLGSFELDECVASRERSGSDLFCPAQEQLIGSSVLLLNSEMRLPLLNARKDAWLPLNFPALDATLFFDLGVAWTPGRSSLVLQRDRDDDIVRRRAPLASYGAGIRLNLFFAILRLDYAVPTGRSRGPGDGIWSVSVGEIF